VLVRRRYKVQEEIGKQKEDTEAHERLGFRVSDNTKIQNIDLEAGPDPDAELQQDQ
jgi:hypothetical protein